MEAILRARVLPCRWIEATNRWEFHPRAARLLGLSAEHLQGPDAIACLLHPADLPRFCQARTSARAGGLGTFEARMRTARGAEIWTQWTLRASREGLLGVVQDISHLHETRTRLMNHQKRELATLLASGLAHDLRNLLQALHGSAELLEVTLAGGEEEHQIAILKKASERAEVLVQRFLKVVREKEQVSSERADLNLQVEETASLLRLALPKAFEVEVRTEPDLPPARFDPGQVLQVLMNLGLNARDAQGERGVIRLRTGLGLPAQEGTEHLYAEVEDEGPGIPQEVQARLFDPFFTTKGGGTGLGLATAQSIARAHGGRLTFDSAPGRGARFRLWLPLDPLTDPQTGSCV
jgi:PAS domain S-box-containing protein